MAVFFSPLLVTHLSDIDPERERRTRLKITSIHSQEGMSLVNSSGSLERQYELQGCSSRHSATDAISVHIQIITLTIKIFCILTMLILTLGGILQLCVSNMLLQKHIIDYTFGTCHHLSGDS